MEAAVKSPSEGGSESSHKIASADCADPPPPVISSAFDIPAVLQTGESMLKVTHKKVMQRLFKIDPDRGQIVWASKKGNRINLESIREVRIGASGASFRTALSISVAHEPRWISIIYQQVGAYKALHLIAVSDGSLERWRETLERLRGLRQQLLDGIVGMEQRNDLWLRQHWKGADSSEDEKLSFKEVVRLCARLGMQASRTELLERFRQADRKGRDFLDFDDFQYFVMLLKRRQEVEELFSEWADLTLGACISLERFRAFMQQEQGVSSANGSRAAVVSSLFAKYSSRRHGGLLYDGFSAFLQSEDNAAIRDASSKTDEPATEGSRQAVMPQPMDQPLTHYFISSSHNTYLVGGQWRGDSTVEGYIRALSNGARSVELDCWDGPNGQPQITHGHTLTSKVPFKDVIAAIARYAFIKSQYPLILSLEVHNDLPQQTTMAKLLRELLGEALLCEKLPKASRANELPTPEELRGKILVKAKNIDLAPEEPTEEISADSDSEAASDLALITSSSYSSATETGSESDNGFFASARGLVRSVRNRRRGDSGNNKTTVAPELAALLVYTVGVKHRGINKKEVYAPEHMISLSEKTAFKYARDRVLRENLIKHNRTHLTRTYPSMGSIARLHASANYFPHHLWAIGCQLVALNWQTLDIGYTLNQAMFTRNAGCGYVLKPSGLRTKDLLKNTDAKVRCVLDVTVISAQQLPRLRDVIEAVDPFVVLSLLAPESWGKQPQDLLSSASDVKSSVHNPTSRPAQRTSSPEQRGAKAAGSEVEASPPPAYLSLQSEARRSVPPPSSSPEKQAPSRPPLRPSASSNMGPRSATFATHIVKGNGFNPIWNCPLQIAIDVPAGEAAVEALSKGVVPPDQVDTLTRGLLDLAFLRFEVCEDVNRSQASLGSSPPQLTPPVLSSGAVLASYTASIGGLERGYRHVPLYDAQLQRYPFSTLFIKSKLRVAGLTDASGKLLSSP
ncbi:PLC-like phosphodiesterase [Microstroma glucosiphilum]|uniref:Phosphoinositide phospholipase C n=1 Tax=Pseudomicrostroma glucosiphilum TaxID=1684307 RepID=A0A316U8F7_9BASI|nr:PLC-like phosphodiesterase [Pseudomicrostroma glucosiphilum]PWN20751.1 PLC-like phosphodiesterase [Pseudomicrostroma glucosiphilum]